MQRGTGWGGGWRCKTGAWADSGQVSQGRWGQADSEAGMWVGSSQKLGEKLKQVYIKASQVVLNISMED